MFDNKVKKILKQVFGYSEFRNLQQEVIENICHKNDTLVIMPTGGGKSLCYQIPALIFEGLTIVVSPLISLMKDQVEQLSTLRINAGILNSSLSYDEYRKNISMVMSRQAKLLYLAPETLMKPNILNMLANITVDCLTIDEAHCISEWGHDFRPEYRQLIEVRKLFPDAVCIALTATATKRVQEDIKTSLGFTDENEYIDSFDRNNLYISIEPKINGLGQALKFIRQFPGQSGIIYCSTRKQVDDLYVILEGENFSIKPYHAGLSEQERHLNQEMFIRDDIQIIVATVAFGMGINKPNVRFVLHYDMPKNIETYYQEIGRAGRDGLRSHCLMLFGYGDTKKIQYFIQQKSPAEQKVAQVHLNALLGFIESHECRRKPLLAYFGETYTPKSCNLCDNCVISQKPLQDITILAQKFLSCVKRTEERFGIHHVINVLRGSKEKKVLKFGHQNLSTYGIGMELSRVQWQHLARQLIQQKLMIQNTEHGTLSITEKAWKVFRGEETVLGLLKTANEKEATRQKDTPVDYDRNLFEQLRIKRKELADAADVPPYVIFSDNTLIEMATFFPQTPKSLLTIHGVGEIRLERYGDDFLSIIKYYCEKNSIKEKPKKSSSSSKKSSTEKQKISSRSMVVANLFNKGQTIEALMEKFGVKKRTILDHLYRCIENDVSINIDKIISASGLSKQLQSRVLDLYEQLGHKLLKPLYVELDESVSYDELQLMRIYYLSMR